MPSGRVSGRTRGVVACRGATWLALSWLAVSPCLAGAAGNSPPVRAFERPEYAAIKRELVRGWGTWDTRDALAQVLLPDGLSVSLSFSHADGKDPFARPQMVSDKKGDEFRAGMHALDGSYSEADINWKGTRLRIQSATQGEDLVVLVTMPEAPREPVVAVVTESMLWGRPGHLSRGNGGLVAQLPSRAVETYVTGRHGDEPGGRAAAARVSVVLDGSLGVSTGKVRTMAQIGAIVAEKRAALAREAARHGPLAEAYDAIRAALGWSNIYDPDFDRVITVVSRDWDVGSGGYILFGWDQFFLSYASSLFNRSLAYANFVEHLRALTPGGFIPNVEVSGGKTSWDRSQPPVGSLMLKEIYKRYGDRWILEASFDDLLSWNRWWVRSRMNGNLLGWGSDLTGNPMHEANAHTAIAAAWESGMDDSPMYDAVPFNPETGLFALQDVGLNGLYVADCRALAEIADTIGRTGEALELRARADRIAGQLESLWVSREGLYLNRRTDTGEFSGRISPTMFYPLIGRVPSPARASAMVSGHLLNPREFGGAYMLPSIARNDPSYPIQHYWRGAVWPPLNFLVYLGLRNYPLPDARRELATKSMGIFLGEWRRKGFICENYSGLDGTGDEPHLTSTPFYSWGVLMGMIGFIEAGQMPAPEDAMGAR